MSRILYYAVGPVHPRNLELIATAMPAWDFCMIYEPELWWMNPALLDRLSCDTVPFTNGRVPSELDPSSFAAVVFSTVQPRLAPVHLLMWALEHDVPAIAIEESNQLALSDGSVNNYLLPVDRLLVASPAEKRGFVSAGLPERRVDVTGWPFYQEHRALSSAARARAKERLGLRPMAQVATLTLNGFNDTSGETPSVRRKLMRMAADGLPPAFQLVIKPHPIEKMDVLMPYVTECAPAAAVIDGSVKIESVLGVTDVLLNRGVSQVGIEALNRKIPVVILSVGSRTPFNCLAPDVVANSPEEVLEIIGRLTAVAAPTDIYADYRREHMPYPPGEARDRTCERIAAIVRGGLRDPDRAAQRIDLALYTGWKLGRREAEAWLRSGEMGDYAAEAEALERLLGSRATRWDLQRLRSYFDGAYAGQVLRCLWIDQLDGRRIKVDNADLNWMADFPSKVNINLFVGHCASWWQVLRNAGLYAVATDFAQTLEKSWGHIPEYGEIIEDMELRERGIRGRGLLFARRLKRLTRRVARKILRSHK